MHIDEVNNVLCVSLEQPVLDAGNTEAFKKKMDDVIERGRDIVIDMAEVEFIDSSGLGALLACLRKLNANGNDMKLARLRPTVKSMFELVRMDKIFEIHDVIEDAFGT